MALSEKGLRLGRDLLAKAVEMGVDIPSGSTAQLAPLFPILPQYLVEQALATCDPALDPDDVLAVFIQLLVSQLPEEQPNKNMGPWAVRKKPR